MTLTLSRGEAEVAALKMLEKKYPIILEDPRGVRALLEDTQLQQVDNFKDELEEIDYKFKVLDCRELSDVELGILLGVLTKTSRFTVG